MLVLTNSLSKSHLQERYYLRKQTTQRNQTNKNIMEVWFVVFVLLTLRVLVQSQDIPGFISIDCGALNGYTDDDLNIQYLSDAGFVDSGQNMQIPSSYANQVESKQMTNLRVFPNGTRNCYTLRPEQGRNNKYLIRALFLYGNYDGKSQGGSFDLHIDANFWGTVFPTSNTTYAEVTYISPRDYIHVCLVNRGTGTPFISALELRLLDNSTYPAASAAAALGLDTRLNAGSPTTYRYPNDNYDRIWGGETSTSLISMTNTTVKFKSNDNYKVPAEVLMSALRTINHTYYIFQTWQPLNASTKWYIYFHFAEIQELPSGQVRAFKVYTQGSVLTTVTPEYLKPLTVATPSPLTGPSIVFNITNTDDATLPPFFNALEIFYAIDLPNPLTDLGDVDGINGIKNVYKVGRVSWQGDPCSPQDLRWNGLICTYDSSPRITSLNLSSSGLTGKIAPSFVNLTAMVSLDLSFNQLTGQLPEFFADMPNLKMLNLSGNSISGPIPSVVKKKISDGSLRIILASNPICQTDPESCTDTGPSGDSNDGSKKKKSSVIPIVIGVIAGVVVLVGVIVAAVLYKKKNNGISAPNDNHSRPPTETSGFNTYYDASKSNQSTGSPMPGNQGIGQMTRAYTSSEVVSITENFKVTIGEGGFGNVYLGTLSDGTKVAVKALSPESKQGYKEFQAEAQLLMIVHHKNLVSLLGYCDEFENMALIYELMPQGNVRQHLSERSTNVLGWNQRLQIAVDSAQGLEYLHNGCRPPIIHRDLKTSNILLDEQMQAKIADFGLSRIFKHEYEESYVSTRPAGTPGYLDPVFNTTGNLNKKSDIYSFGIILFELITGHPAVIRNQKGSTHIVQWVSPLIERGDVQSIVDPRFDGQFDPNSVWKVIETAMLCVQLVSSQRPDINQVLSDLKESLRIESNNQRGGTESNYTESSSYDVTSFELNVGPAAR